MAQTTNDRWEPPSPFVPTEDLDLKHRLILEAWTKNDPARLRELGENKLADILEEALSASSSYQ